MQNTSSRKKAHVPASTPNHTSSRTPPGSAGRTPMDINTAAAAAAGKGRRQGANSTPGAAGNIAACTPGGFPGFTPPAGGSGLGSLSPQGLAGFTPLGGGSTDGGGGGRECAATPYSCGLSSTPLTVDSKARKVLQGALDVATPGTITPKSRGKRGRVKVKQHGGWRPGDRTCMYDASCNGVVGGG